MFGRSQHSAALQPHRATFKGFLFSPPTVPTHDNPLVVEQMAQTCWSASVRVWATVVGLLTILDWARFADHP